MKVFLSNKEENGTEHIVGFRNQNVIIDEQGNIKIPITYEKLEILEKDIKELKEKIKPTPVRGQRINAGIIEESAGDLNMPTYMGFFYPKNEENDVHLNQKERNVIRNQIEGVLYKFERYVDEHLSKNELELAKVDHNVVMVARSILNKFDIVDFEEKYKIGAKLELIKNIESIDRYDMHKSIITKGIKGYVRNINYDKNEFEIFLESCVVLTCDIDYFDKNFIVYE